MKKTVFFLSFASLIQAADFAFPPPKELNLAYPRDFSFYADALALQAKEDGLDFAIADLNGPTMGIRNGVLKGFSDGHGDYNFNPGLRVGMEFLFGCDRWNFDMVWTFLKITNSKHVDLKNTGVLVPLWLVPVGVPTSTNNALHATWEANFNLLDIRMGKAIQISNDFVANPHIGGRIAFIDQHFGIRYGGFFGARRDAISHNDNDFAGFGLRGGIDTEWNLGKNIGLFSQLAASLIWGHFTTAQQLTQGTTEGYDITENINQNTPNLELSVGLDWGRSFNCDQYRLNARLAYEFQEWWDMNRLRRFFSDSASDSVSRGNFTLNGISFRLQVDL